MMKLVTISLSAINYQTTPEDNMGVMEHLTQYLENGWEIVSVTSSHDYNVFAVVLQNSPPKYASR